jgi:hypothetical protein
MLSGAVLSGAMLWGAAVAGATVAAGVDGAGVAVVPPQAAAKMAAPANRATSRILVFICVPISSKETNWIA